MPKKPDAGARISEDGQRPRLCVDERVEAVREVDGGGDGDRPEREERPVDREPAGPRPSTRRVVDGVEAVLDRDHEAQRGVAEHRDADPRDRRQVDVLCLVEEREDPVAERLSRGGLARLRVDRGDANASSPTEVR